MQPENILLTAFGALAIAAIASLAMFLRRVRTSPGRRRWSRILAGNLLSLLALGSLALFGGEVYYRFVYDATDAFSQSKVSKRWFDRHFVRNAAGVRDPGVEYAQAPRPGSQRVSFFGDSFTVGHGVADVEKRFVNLVRARHPELEVHMFAKPGADTGDELSTLKELIGAGYRLDVVVLVYCLNDISDIVPEWKTIAQRIQTGGDAGYLVEHSYFLNLYYWRWRAARDPDVHDYYRFVLDAYEGPLWKEQKRRLSEFARTVDSAHGRLLVVTFPFFNGLAADSPYRDVHERLDLFWSRLGIPQLDLRELYLAHASEDLVVNGHDPHPNERAHALAADAIESFLLAEIGRGRGDEER